MMAKLNAEQVHLMHHEPGWHTRPLQGDLQNDNVYVQVASKIAPNIIMNPICRRQWRPRPTCPTGD